MAKGKRGRPSSVTITIKEEELRAADSNIKQLFKSEVRKFGSSSGGYIPISQNYYKHKVFILVLEQ